MDVDIDRLVDRTVDELVPMLRMELPRDESPDPDGIVDRVVPRGALIDGDGLRKVLGEDRGGEGVENTGRLGVLDGRSMAVREGRGDAGGIAIRAGGGL